MGTSTSFGSSAHSAELLWAMLKTTATTCCGWIENCDIFAKTRYLRMLSVPSLWTGARLSDRWEHRHLRCEARRPVKKTVATTNTRLHERWRVQSVLGTSLTDALEVIKRPDSSPVHFLKHWGHSKEQFGWLSSVIHAVGTVQTDFKMEVVREIVASLDLAQVFPQNWARIKPYYGKQITFWVYDKASDDLLRLYTHYIWVKIG